MHKEKYTALRKPKRTKANQRKMTLVLVSVLVTALISAGLTAAYIFTGTELVGNIFVPADVFCEVEETFQNNLKENVNIRNTGKADSFIRAAVVANWVKTDENGKVTEVYAKTPVAGTDYVITYPDSFNWIEDTATGFFYYKNVVPVGEQTEILIKTCIQGSNANVPEGYTLSVEIIASAIQSSPEKAAEENWGVTVENNKITAVMAGN